MKLRFIMLLLLMGATSFTAHAKETKDVLFKFKNAEPVVFSHDIHLSKYNNNCRVCHNAIFNLKNRRHYTMAEMEKTKSCGACHSGVKAFSVASEKDCVRCHKGKPKDMTYKMKGATDVVFSHTTHLAKKGISCRSCHNGKVITGKEKNVTMAEMEKGKTCGACHNDSKAFTVAGYCGNCHKGMKPGDVAFKLKDVADVQFSHKVHLDMDYKCTTCHTKLFPYKRQSGMATMDDMEKGASCGACHNGKDAATVAGNCTLCHKGMKPGEVVFKLKNVADAQFNHKVHLDMDYKCANCHTKLFPYKKISGKATMADMEKGASCGACHNGKDAATVAGNCTLCHKGYKPGIITFKNEGGEVTFSHYSHLNMYKCADCHTGIFPLKAGAKHATMSEMEQGKSCGACHSGKDAFSVKGDCERCHKM